MQKEKKSHCLEKKNSKTHSNPQAQLQPGARGVFNMLCVSACVSTSHTLWNNHSSYSLL